MAAIAERRTRIVLKEHDLLHAQSTSFPGNYPGYDDSWSHDKFKKDLKIERICLADRSLEFDMIGIDAAISNAFRRILLAEVPSMAVDKVFVNYNSSIIQDEVLCHRLGLIPIKADPRLFEYRQQGNELGNENDTIEFELKITCKRKPDASKDATDADELYINHSVLSKHFKWNPIGNQLAVYGENAFQPVDGDILIAKLRPGHEIDVRMHCIKSIGKDHAKFSPVAPASYRLLPEIVLTKDVRGEAAERLQSCFSKGVIELDKQEGETVARIANAREDMCSRNVFVHEDLKNCVALRRVRNHFIWSIESVGALPPDILMCEAIKTLMGKCQSFLKELEVVGK